MNFRVLRATICLLALTWAFDWKSYSKDPFPIIDAHIHTSFSGDLEESSNIPMTKEQLLSEMKESGVIGAVAHSDENDIDYEDLSTEGIIHR